MRSLLLLVLGAATAAAQRTHTAVYHAGPHFYSTLDRKGDVYFAGSRGRIPVSLYGDNPKSRDLQLTYALTNRLALVAQYYWAHEPWEDSWYPEWFRHSTIAAGIGTLSTPGAWRRQHQITLGFATSDAALRSLDNEGPPSERAAGRYWRLAYQYSSILRGRYADVGAVARLSAVRFTRFEQRGRLWGQAIPAPSGDPYTEPMVVPGSLTGAFFEPGFMARFGYGPFKVGPEISILIPFAHTAFDRQPFSLGLAAGINIQLRGPR